MNTMSHQHRFGMLTFFFHFFLFARCCVCVCICMYESVSVCWSCCLLLMLLVECLLLLSFVPSIVTSSYTTRGTLYKTSLLQAANPHTNPLSSALPLFSPTHLVAGASDHFYTHTRTKAKSNNSQLSSLIFVVVLTRFGHSIHTTHTFYIFSLY